MYAFPMPLWVRWALTGVFTIGLVCGVLNLYFIAQEALRRRKVA